MNNEKLDGSFPNEERKSEDERQEGEQVEQSFHS